MAESVAAVGEHPERDQLGIELYTAEIRCVQCGEGDRVRVDGVGFAAVAGGVDPYLRGEFRGDVEDGFTVVDQSVREVAADAVAALDRPDPIVESLSSTEHFRITGVHEGPGGNRGLPASMVVRDTGIEPVTSSVSGKRSPAELIARELQSG